MERVLHVGSPIGGAEEALDVGLVLGEEELVLAPVLSADVEVAMAVVRLLDLHVIALEVELGLLMSSTP
jgi:hypothetical protein